MAATFSDGSSPNGSAQYSPFERLLFAHLSNLLMNGVFINQFGRDYDPIGEFATRAISNGG